MSIPFSQLPGRHERHFMRKVKNALFDQPIDAYSDEELLEVQRLDHEELLSFLQELRGCVQEAVSLKPNVESQVLLDMKIKLDHLFEIASGLADQQGANKQAIAELTAVIMQKISEGAKGDPLAEQELMQEQQAREQHYQWLDVPLVADLLHADSVIREDELVPTLLSASTEHLQVALQMFQPEQLQSIAVQAEKLMTAKNINEQEYAEVFNNLKLLQQAL